MQNTVKTRLSGGGRVVEAPEPVLVQATSHVAPPKKEPSNQVLR